MPDPSLLLLLDIVRTKTLRVLRGVSPQQALWTPPGLHNSILWHAGHSYVVVENTTLAALKREPEVPDGWFALFSWESRPAETPADRYPPLDQVVARLEAQHARLREVIAGLDDAQLEAATGHPVFTTVRSSILHGLNDEARHNGEISLLRKLQGLPAQAPA